MELPTFPSERFDEVGLCIYCGTTTCLEDEHIIPFGLGGNSVLPKSSCRRCATVTSKFERTVLRGPLRPVRVALGIQSRRKHRGASRDLPLRVRRGEEWTTLLLPYSEYPLVVDFHIFSIPGVLDPTYLGGTRIRGHQSFSFGARPSVVLQKLRANEISAPRVYDPSALAKLTAKIGYAQAVGSGAIDPSLGRPAVVSSILGEVDEIGRWIGTVAEPRFREPSVLHQATVQADLKNNLLIARVQYLTIVGTPVYGVILGNLKDSFVCPKFGESSRNISREVRWTSTPVPFET